MSVIRFSKVVSNLPQQLEPDTIYLVRVGSGFDLYCTDATGSIAYQIGNAATATKLQTPRTITIGNTSKSFDGSANVSWSLAEIGVTGFVTETGTQTLSNKTIVDPKLQLGGTNGTAGQVLMSQGAGLPPVWGSVGGLGSGGTFATGDILLTARTLTAPDWLPADGTVYLQSSYPALFAKVGTLVDPRLPWTPRTSSFGTTVIDRKSVV